MHRRNFIYLTGTALGTLLFRGELFGREAPVMVQLPDKILITLEDGTHEAVRSASGTWSFRGASVTLRHRHGALQAAITSPGEALSNVVLVWKYEVSGSTLFLGDHWERTYGDLHFESAAFARKMPWYVIQHNSQTTTCFGVKTGCSTFCHWQLGDGKLQLTLDTRNGGKGVLLGDRVLKAAEIVSTQTLGNENTFATARRFCSIMCDDPLTPRQPVYGINDWYITYGANSSKIILDHTERMTGLAENTQNRPFSVVDSGWAKYSPLMPNDCCWQDDFSQANEHFKDMHVLADNIKKLAMQPGLWTRPLCAAHNDPKNLLLPHIAGKTNLKKPVLDPSIPENLARVKRNIKLYRQWGYDLVKHDFTTYDIFGKWGSDMAADITAPNWSFDDRSRTSAEIILDLYQTIRKAAGSMYVMGCNTVSHLSAGLFELNRIGDDTSGKEWDRTRKMGVNTLGFRMIQHGTFYAADGDCVGLTTAVPWAKNKQWMQLLAASGTPLFISAQEAATGEEQKRLIKESFALAATKLPPAEPLDWLEEQWPKKWRLNREERRFEW